MTEDLLNLLKCKKKNRQWLLAVYLKSNNV